jgi:hypothetical protein
MINSPVQKKRKKKKQRRRRRRRIKINSCVYHQIGIVILINSVTVRNIAGS